MADAPPNWAMLKPICSSYSQRRFSSLNQTQTMFRQKKNQVYNFNLNFNEFFSSSSKKAATSWLLLNTRYSWLLAAKFVAKPVSVSGQRMAAALFGRGSLLSKIKPQLADWRNGWRMAGCRQPGIVVPCILFWCRGGLRDSWLRLLANLRRPLSLKQLNKMQIFLFEESLLYKIKLLITLVLFYTIFYLNF